MINPHWWLQIIRRVEKIVSCALAVTMAWLYLWSVFWTDQEGRVQAISFMILVVFLGVMIEGTVWCVNMYLLEVIDDTKSDEDYKKIQEGRWPSG